MSPSCVKLVAADLDAFSTAVLHAATPSRRLVEVARGFGENVVLGSLCQDHFGDTMGPLIRAVGEKMSGQSGH